MCHLHEVYMIKIMSELRIKNRSENDLHVPLMFCSSVELFIIPPKALAKRTRKSTQVLDLRSTCVSFGHPLALTLVELKFGRK